jgi:hypothetical protein
MDFVEELRKSFGSGQPTEQQLREALVSEKHWFYETGANTTQELVQRLSVRFGDQAPSGDQLDGIITSRKAWIPTREYSYAQLKEAGRTEEVLEKVRVWQNRSKSAIEVFTMEVWSRRRHRAAEMIEQICAIRESEAHRVNLFVEHLYHGWLWGGPGPTFQKCPWHGKDGLPKRSGLGEWMAIVMPFLKKITGEDASKLSVFRHLLGARRYVYAGGEATGGRLAGDDPTYIWNQVENRIRKAWVPMANQAVKRSAKKAA